jgi:hypothetical protein
VGKLADRATSDVYDSRHFKAVDKPETHDVGLRVWAIGSEAAEAQFRKLLGDLPARLPPRRWEMHRCGLAAAT